MKASIKVKLQFSKGFTASGINDLTTHDVATLHAIVKTLDSGVATYSAPNEAGQFMARQKHIAFATFMRQEIQHKEQCRRIGTARNYSTALKSFLSFCNGAELPVKEITPELIEDYAAWLTGKGVCNNSISYYMRTLRAVYMRMVKEGLTADRHPFVNVYTGVDKTRKRAITEADIRIIKNLNLGDNRKLNFVRDMFILSFYLMGISFVDLAYLKKNDVKNGHIVYKRCKTGQQITIAIVPKIQLLLDKYPAPEGSVYLLPIIASPHKDARKQYQNMLRQVNKYLKVIAAKAGLAAQLTSYTSRHSWASIAKVHNINISTISDALGHQNEATTRIYLATLDTTHVDKANEIILSGL